MVDPNSVATVASLTLALVKAWSDDDFELSGDGWAALQQFVSSAPKLLEMFGDEFDEELAARLTKLGIEAFREALRRHWAGSELAVPNLVQFWQRWSSKHARVKEIETCVKMALDLLTMPAEGGELTRPLPELLVDQPELLPLYQVLLRAFVEHGRDVDPPLLSLGDGGGRREFDRHFRAAWKQLLTRQAGGELLHWLEAVGDERRRESVRELLLGRLAAWSSGHVFASDVPDLPWMPLEDFYVEPRGYSKSMQKEAPLLGTIEAALKQNLVVFVTADFGYGKSLAVRTLASRWARAYLEQQGTGPRAPLPIYVPCGALDWSGKAMKINELIRMAWMDQIEAITGEKLAADDDGLAPPTREPSIVILDGLDEAQLSSEELGNLLREVQKATSSRGRRFLLLFRPGLLSSLRLGDRVEHIRIQPFDDHEIERWLGRWSHAVGDGEALTFAELAPVRELASVPILLFMIAYQRSRGQGTAIANRHTLYESFAITLARGKLKATGEQSQRIQATAELLVQRLEPRLVSLRAARPGASPEDGVLALLWLMGRIAWMGYASRKGPELGLSERDVDRVLQEELGVERVNVDFHRISLLTSMQGRLDRDMSQRYMFFGHRSLHEFFVAWYWKDTLIEIARGPSDSGLDPVERLLEGHLIPPFGADDQALDFLLELLEELDPKIHVGIACWAHTFARGIVSEPRVAGHPNWGGLKLAALAVDCHLNEFPHFGAMEFRSLFSQMWHSDAWRPLHAPGVRVYDADLSYVNLSGAKLSGSDFEDAVFQHAVLVDVDLCWANLRNAWLSNVQIDIDHAEVWYEGHARQPSHARFNGADLGGATLRKIDGLILTGVSAEGMTAEQVVFRESMDGMFQGAFFGFSVFAFVRIGLADFSGAIFSHCVFVGSDFSGANMEGARFDGCRFEGTCWPTDFIVPEGLSTGTGLAVALNSPSRPSRIIRLS